MLIQKENLKIGVLEVLAALVSLLYLIGIHSWFPVCAVMGDTIMACHWAGRVLQALALLLALLSVAHLFVPDEMAKTGMDVAMAGIAMVTLFTPGHIINLCMMEEMNCRSNTLPFTIGFGVLMILLLIADIVFWQNRIAKAKHERPVSSEE